MVVIGKTRERFVPKQGIFYIEVSEDSGLWRISKKVWESNRDWDAKYSHSEKVSGPIELQLGPIKEWLTRNRMGGAFLEVRKIILGRKHH